MQETNAMTIKSDQKCKGRRGGDLIVQLLWAKILIRTRRKGRAGREKSKKLSI